jgi:glucose-6-phosphate dehydrogenase assembly protein OpcA
MPAIAPERILRQLSDLWASLAHPNNGEATASGVLRACSMTLIVAAADEADAQAVSETVAALMHEHPSRAIVLKPGAPGAELDARVFAQCWMPFGGRQQICCEQIEITAGLDRLDDAPPVMYGLLAPDLPSVLWCRGAMWWESAEFRELLEMIGKVIIDSRRFASPKQAFQLIRSLIDQQKRAGDLAWASVTGWRELIAHALDAPGNRARLEQVQTVRVLRREDASPIPALYVAAWLKRALPAAEVAIDQTARGPGEIAGVIVSGPGWELSFRRTECDSVEVCAGALERPLVLPPMDDYSVMREELSIPGRDPIFEAVFPLAEPLARELS